MSFTQRTFLYLVLCYFFSCCVNFNCQCYEVSTGEAERLFEMKRTPYLTDDFGSNHIKNDNFKGLAESEQKNEMGKQTDVENNQIWANSNTPAQECSTDGKSVKKFWNTEFGETEKIITVRVSSSVARSSDYGSKPNFEEKPKLAAFQRVGFNVEEPAPRMSMSSYSQRGLEYDFPRASLPHRNVPQEIWVQHTTEIPHENEDKYYETRIEAVSSHKEVVFGKPNPKAVTSTTTPPGTDYDYYQEPRQEYSELSNTKYELPETNYETPEMNYEMSEKNYEVDEAVSVMTNGAAREPQGEPGEGSKLGYVMDGRNFRKYRVEERTPDGFIVGEYGFVRHEDGKLHGVRYTADVAANPRLIYDALVKFLSL